MPAFTTNQWAILFLVLLLGWLLGLISRSGGGKWRRAYEAERDARAEELAARDGALATANARIAELERERTVPAARPIAAGVVDPDPIAAAPVATPATLDLTKDDLSLIRGIGADGAAMLHDEGVYRYAQIAAFTTDEEHALEDRLGADRGYIEQERWREQAALLADGKIDEHRSRFG